MRGIPTRALAAAGLLVVILLAGVVSFYASGAPDGLSRVAEDLGLAEAEEAHAAEDSPFAGYETQGVGEARVSKGVSGLVGAGVVLLLGTGLFHVVRRKDRERDSDHDGDHDSERV